MSTKEYGCFFCNGKSTIYSGNCPDCGKPIDISKELLKLKIDDLNILEIIGRGFYGWTVKVEDEDLYQPFSMKIIPCHYSGVDALGDREARALVTCSPHRNIARFWRQIHESISLYGQKVEVLCLIFEYIANARPLSQVIADSELKLMRSDVVSILAGIAFGLSRMHSRDLWHHDLHDDNVLVRTIEPDENLNEHYEAKLIDFGSAKPLRPGEPEKGERGDYSYLAKHILELVLSFEIGNEGLITPADRSFSNRLRRIAQRVDDKNVSRRNMKPEDIAREIQKALEECSTGYNFPSFDEMKKQSRISFDEPLANTNALNLAPQDIALLFRDSLGWEARIKKSEPVFVLGPRGCGKTMLLRYLSIESQARPLKEENTSEEVAKRLQNMQHVGFLVSVGQMRTPFLRSAYKKLQTKDSSLADEFCREFFNAQFAYEVLRTMVWLYAEKLIIIHEDELKPLCSATEDLIGIEFVGKANLEILIEAIDRRVRELSSLSNPDAYMPTNLSRDDVLLSLSRAIKSCTWARSKEIWFLLDDYSVTMIPALAICAYNPVLFRLSSEVKLKISSEGDGPILEDNLGRKYKEGRELSKVNLGEVYFQTKEEEGLHFFEQILEARFNETGRGSLVELKKMLGEHPNEEGFGEYICSHTRPGDARFHGFGLLCRLCSGDVSFIIELLNSISQGRWGDKLKYPTEKEQDDITKRFAQRQLADLKSISEQGPKLYDFAECLGNLLKKYLLASDLSKGADERLRIEIEGSGELSISAKTIHDALLRHSVLIAGGSGKSKEGLPTRKLYFRRLFAPCFPFSPSRKGCIALKITEYEKWLLDPKKIWEKPRQTELPLLGDA